MAKRPKPFLGEDDPTAGIIPGCEFLPQWWDDDLDLQYGPSLNGFQEQCRSYKQSIYGGGLWDFAEERASTGRRMTDKTGQERYDFDAVSGYVGRHSAEMSIQYLRVYQLFFVERMSYKGVASSMNLTSDHVRKLVQRIRKKAKNG